MAPHSQPSANQQSLLTQVQAEFFSGPIPPPSYLARYNDVVPNGADRIISMAERQGAHRESLETMVVKGNVANQRLGSIFAFIICVLAISGGFWLINTGKSAAGLASILTPLAGVIAVFFYSKKEQKAERIEKSNVLTKHRNK
ncbi:MAG TPA: DUF2335 domain-containing protein [Terracidiphilus sp.]|nr:DUF2335 domain-containing protein [Terracidiphilus sp.]